MSKEILFRGFHEDENGTQIAVANGKEYKGKWVEGYYSKHCGYNYISYNTSDKDFENYIISEKVLPETVGEYIKSLPNGDKAFSNSRFEIISTVKGEDGGIGKRIDTAILRFNEKHCDWELKVTHNGAYKAGYFLNNSDTKVIGTIFDKEME